MELLASVANCHQVAQFALVTIPPKIDDVIYEQPLTSRFVQHNVDVGGGLLTQSSAQAVFHASLAPISDAGVDPEFRVQHLP